MLGHSFWLGRRQPLSFPPHRAFDEFIAKRDLQQQQQYQQSNFTVNSMYGIINVHYFHMHILSIYLNLIFTNIL